MANPSWSLDNISFNTLPGKYRYGGRPHSKEDADIRLETDNGVEFIYNLFSRDVIEVVFRLTSSQMDTFRSFHLSVSGQSTPFYFSLSGIGAASSIYVRKEPGFDPVELDTPGGTSSMFDYTLRLRTALV